eukprot:scaffold555_cov292-Prasinococcus_capsulatus_cf.AAC.3
MGRGSVSPTQLSLPSRKARNMGSCEAQRDAVTVAADKPHGLCNRSHLRWFVVHSAVDESVQVPVVGLVVAAVVLKERARQLGHLALNAQPILRVSVCQRLRSEQRRAPGPQRTVQLSLLRVSRVKSSGCWPYWRPTASGVVSSRNAAKRCSASRRTLGLELTSVSKLRISICSRRKYCSQLDRCS